VQVSNTTRLLCGLTLITVPTIEIGGAFLLRMLRSREPGYVDNPLRQDLFRAGHAHAGVIVILSLICQLLADTIVLSEPLDWIVRLGAPGAAILMPLGFFLSVASPRADRSNTAIRLVNAGAISLAVAILILGIGLLRAAT
jgi:hypothetical protein